MTMRLVRVRRSPTGRRVGESHPRAKASADDVRLMRALHEEGIGYGRIAEKFELPKSTVQYICSEQSRTYE